MLGFKTGKIEEDGSPDPWWLVAGYSFVFEDYVNAKPDSAVDATKARQATTHPNWMRKNVPGSEAGKILAVLVTPVKAMKKEPCLTWTRWHSGLLMNSANGPRVPWRP